MGESRSWLFVHQIYPWSFLTILRSHTHSMDSDLGLAGVCVCRNTLPTYTTSILRDQMRRWLFACGFFGSRKYCLGSNADEALAEYPSLTLSSFFSVYTLSNFTSSGWRYGQEKVGPGIKGLLESRIGGDGYHPTH